jgi:hypothetical protein
MFSRREFFKQLFQPENLRKLIPLPGENLVELGQTLGVVPERADACEQAGLALGRLKRKSLAGLVSANDPKTSATADDDAGRK